MIILLDREGTVDGFSRLVSQVSAHPDVQGVLVMAADGNGFGPAQVDPILTGLPVPLFGGLFPALLYGREILTKGTLVVGLRTRPHVQVIHGLSSNRPDFESALDDSCLRECRARTMFVIVDGMAQRVSTLLASLFNVFGLEVNYLGGGAGSMDIVAKPCVLSNAGLMSDCAVLAVTDLCCGVGVSHGMQSVAGPFRITGTRANALCSLDGQPAFDHFRTIVRALAGEEATSEGFPVSPSFSIAVQRLGSERVVRDPSRVEPDGALHVAPEVFEGEFVDIVHATPESTIAAARRALELAKQHYRGERPHEAVVCFDCSGRAKFLGPRFPEELAVIQDGDRPVIGALTIGGEIANSGRDYLDYYNRTCIVGALEG